MEIDEKHLWKKRIALDIDGTLWDFYGPFFEFYNNKYGTNYDLTDFNCELAKLLNLTQEQLNEEFREFEGTAYCEDLPLYPNVSEILLKLSQKYFFVLITAKDSTHREVIRERLKRKLPKFDFPIYFSGDYVGAAGGKDEICREIGCEAIIEDNLGNALSCANSGIKSILVNRYWNQGGEHENLVRVMSWDEVLDLFP
ncbi:hypothetical protein GW932_01880 [archaeon]|nr:hypothetical protein [archaeon]